MPVFARASLDDPGFCSFTSQALAHDLDFKYQRLDIAGQHNIAAAAQHKLGRGLQFWVLQQRGDVGFGFDTCQAKRLSHNTKGVVRLEGDVFLD